MEILVFIVQRKRKIKHTKKNGACENFGGKDATKNPTFLLSKSVSKKSDKSWMDVFFFNLHLLSLIL